MPILRVLLLGPPLIELDNRPVQINRRIQRALLFYLAAQGGLVNRVELINLLYPSDDEELARRHLREALSKLRADLPDDGLLVTSQDRVGIASEKVYSDVVEFRHLVEQIGRTPWQLPPGAPLPAAIYHSLYRAIRLWRTPQFMAGAVLPDKAEVESWFSRTGQGLERVRGQVLERLADHATASGDLEAALTWLRSALETDELNENLHYRVMNLLVNLGRRTETVKYYQSLETLFHRELDIDPPQPITALYQKAQETTGPLPIPNSHSGWPVSFSMQVPFVGREREMDDLRKAFHRGGLVSVFGEAGAGKSRMVKEVFMSSPSAPGLLLVSAHRTEHNLPFQPLTDLLRNSIHPDDLEKLSPAWIAQLAIFLPDLLHQYPEGSSVRQVQPDQAHSLIFEAFRQLFLVISKRQRLLIFLDDAQWADEATLATFSYLIERAFFNDHGLLVIAARQEEKNPHLDELIRSAEGLPYYRRIDLPQLGEEEIGEVIRFAFKQTPSPDLPRRLARDTGGNPLFLLETLRAILELSSGLHVKGRSMDVFPLAGSIQSLVRTRLHYLPPQARQVLTTAAILGNTFDPLLIEMTGQLDPEQIATGLEQLEDVHLIQPLPAAQDQPGPLYQFVHDKIREVMELELSPVRKRLYHLRAARALETLANTQTPQPESWIAQHYEKGGDPRSAFPYWIRAGQKARRLLSRLEAYAAFQHAEQLLTGLAGNLGEMDIYSLYASWGELAVADGDLETIGRIYHTLLHLAQQRRSPFLAGVALSGLSCLSEIEGATGEGLVYLDQAIPYLENSPLLFEKVQVFIRRGNLLRQAQRYPEATTSYQLAIEHCADETGDEFQRARSTAFCHIATMLIHTGWPEEAYRHAEQALQATWWTADLTNEIQAYGALANSAYLAGQIDLARLHAQKGLWVCERAQAGSKMGALQIILARAELALGNLDEGWQQLHAALSLGERWQDQVVIQQGNQLKAHLSLFAGDLEQAGELLMGQNQTELLRYESLDNLLFICMVPAFEKNAAGGIRFLEEKLAITRRVDPVQPNLPGKLARAVLLWLEGQPGEAVEITRQVEEEARLRGFGCLPNAAALLRVQILQNLGRAQEALGEIKAVNAWAEQSQDPWMQIQTTRLLTRMEMGSDFSAGDVNRSLASKIARLEAGATLEAVRKLLEKIKGKILD